MRRLGWMAVVACLLLTGSVRGADDRAYLVGGVETIGSPGIPGALCLYGERAFTVVIGSVDRRPTPVVAAARLGKGRLVAFGHEGYFGDLKSGDTARLLLNSVRWAASRDVKEGIPKVGLRGLAALEGHLREQGIEVRQLGGGWMKELGGFDAVVTSPAGLSQAEVQALRAFVEGGGGVLAGIPGWGWKQLNPGKSIGDELAGNRLFGAAGIAWADGYQSDTAPGGFNAKAEPPRLAHAGVALDTLEALASGKTIKLSKDDTAVAVAAVTRCAMSVPSDDTLFRPKLQRLLTAHGGTVKLPKPTTPLTDADGLAKVILTMQLRRDLLLPPDQVKAHPAAAFFPGSVPADAERVTRKVAVDTAVPAWHSTGLYAAPGEVVAVTVPQAAARKGLSVRIGAHNDRLWHLSKWHRAPEVCRRFPIDAPATKAANAFGGLVYIEVPGNCKLGEVEVEVAGAVEAPLFVLGKTSEDDWRKTIRTRPAPWGEVANDKVIITVKAEHLRTVDDPERLMKFWADVMDACADLATIPRERGRPERYVSDVQISAGYMHSGYPIMTWLDAGPRFVNHKLLTTKGDWGMFHEMGHNHQSGLWTFGGTGETTCNLFTVYVLETVCKVTGGHGGIDPARRAQKIKAHLAGGADFAKWQGDPFLSLAMYLQLKDAFGWEPYKKVFAEYRGLRRGEAPRNDAEKRDQWMTRFSRAVGRDLGPFFEKWGVPTSSAARESIAKLPAWMPPEFQAEAERGAAGRPVAFVTHRIGTYRSEACGVADFNGDGKLDIVAGPFLYLAPGWTPHRIRTLKGKVDEKGMGYNWDFMNAPLDVDGDGLLDVVSCNWHGKAIEWYRNTGKAGGEWPCTVIEVNGNFEHGELWDIDGDGKALEILPAVTGTWWYELDGKGGFVKHMVSPKTFDWGVGCGDVNGDGRPDLLRPGAWFEAPADPRKGTWTEHPLTVGSRQEGKAEHTPQILVYDVNADGLPDIVTSNAHGHGIFWYQQTRDGGKMGWKQHLIDDTWTQAHALTLADLDGDGDLDLVTGKRFLAHNGHDPEGTKPPGVYWYELTRGPKPTWTKHVITFDEGIGAGMNIPVVDLDGDGDLDIVVTGKWGGPAWFENKLK